MFFPSFLHSSLPFFRGSIDFFTQYSKLLHLNPELTDKTKNISRVLRLKFLISQKHFSENLDWKQFVSKNYGSFFKITILIGNMTNESV